MGEGGSGSPGGAGGAGGAGGTGAEAPPVSAGTAVVADIEAARARDRRERHRPNTKIVCRRLPPTMSEESFLEQVAPIPDHDYFYYSKPDASLAPNLFCRAYINFVNVDDIFIFRDKFDDYIFLDDKGNEYPAIVEYAPFQRILKKRRKKDVKCGTIENDPSYMEFLESLKETDSDTREPKMEYSYQPTEEKKETTTPLLDFLAARKREERRRREEKQRRRPRNRLSKDDDNFDDIKQIKSRDNDDKSVIDEKDDDGSPTNDDGVVEIKEVHYQNKSRSKNFKDQRRTVDDHRKRSDFNKKDKPGKDTNDGDVVDEDKSNRRERRDRQRESYRDKYKEKDKFYDLKKERFKSEKKPHKVAVYKELDEKEQDKTTSVEVKPIVSIKTGDKVVKGPPSSSNIKPFTQLPQFKVADLTKVIDEMDRQKSEGVKVEVVNPTDSAVQIIKNAMKDTVKSVDAKKPDLKHGKVVVKRKDDKNESSAPKTTKGKSNKDTQVSPDVQQRRNSLESKQKSNTNDETVLRRNKSLEENSHESNNGSDKNASDKSKDNSSDPRTERRIRNKDRPSLAIYQPGMGKFSKQRIEREKDPVAKPSDKIGNSSNSSSNSVNSQDLLAEE
ncbi:UPF3 regulator of nonsense mediated mRNA decay [Arctopsyche grandis]|uniref:UPF3 regulator of nonsense mediated mRNA decay n=1 Tax=Arctopsyche grandis TaxID=121162 RepID=UPI00406D9EB3